MLSENEIRQRVYADPQRRDAFRLYSDGMLSLESYQRIRDERIAEITAEITAEPRGAARKRLIRAAMQIIKHGDQETAMQMIASDDSAARLNPDMDDRFEWARGICNFCEVALGIRSRF